MIELKKDIQIYSPTHILKIYILDIFIETYPLSFHKKLNYTKKYLEIVIVQSFILWDL